MAYVHCFLKVQVKNNNNTRHFKMCFSVWQVRSSIHSWKQVWRLATCDGRNCVLSIACGKLFVRAIPHRDTVFPQPVQNIPYGAIYYCLNHHTISEQHRRISSDKCQQSAKDLLQALNVLQIISAYYVMLRNYMVTTVSTFNNDIIRE